MSDTDATAAYTGFDIPNYSELLDGGNTKAKEIYGDDARTESSSYLGQFNRNMAYLFNQMYMQLQDAYFARYIDTAEGTDLDRIGAFYSLPRKPATVATVQLSFTGTAGSTIPAGSLFSTTDDVMFESIDNVTIGTDGTATVDAESSDKNASANVAANQIVVGVNQINGVDSVNNPQQASGGADAETDAEYRKRLHAADNSIKGPTNAGLYTALYDVEGVKLVKIIEEPIDNSKDLALHFYVDGGRPVDIAQCILDNYAFGMVLHGSEAVTLTDSGGYPKTIRFDLAESVPIYFLINIGINNEFDTNNGLNDMRTSLSNYITDLDMGAKIDYYRLYQIVYNISGVTTADVAVKAGSNGNYVKDSIQLETFDSAMIQSPNNDVVVNING